MTINEQFKEYGVVPVVVLNDAKNALPLAKALVEGGLASVLMQQRSPFVL